MRVEKYIIISNIVNIFSVIEYTIRFYDYIISFIIVKNKIVVINVYTFL